MPKKKLFYPEELQVLLRNTYQRNWRSWMSDHSVSADYWPKEFSLGDPIESDASRQTEAITDWIKSWDLLKESDLFQSVLWRQKQWKNFGIQRLPWKVAISSASDLAEWSGQSNHWRSICERYQYLVTSWPQLESRLMPVLEHLSNESTADFENLCVVIEWLLNNPSSDLYPRQIPVHGIHSKWLERRLTTVAFILNAIREPSANVLFPYSQNSDMQLEEDEKTIQLASNRNDDEISQLDYQPIPESLLTSYQICGLRARPHLVRIRLLDEALQPAFNGLSYLSVPIEDLANLAILATNVVILENLQTFLSLEPQKSTLAIMGAGYSVVLLEKCSWLLNARCFYWGDLDTYGFDILSKARKIVPNLKSVLMDEDTLLRHRELWGTEAKQKQSVGKENLTESEFQLYSQLIEHHWARNLRLEQERINWDYSTQLLKKVLEFG